MDTGPRVYVYRVASQLTALLGAYKQVRVISLVNEDDIKVTTYSPARPGRASVASHLQSVAVSVNVYRRRFEDVDDADALMMITSVLSLRLQCCPLLQQQGLSTVSRVIKPITDSFNCIAALPVANMS